MAPVEGIEVTHGAIGSTGQVQAQLEITEESHVGRPVAPSGAPLTGRHLDRRLHHLSCFLGSPLPIRAPTFGRIMKRIRILAAHGDTLARRCNVAFPLGSAWRGILSPARPGRPAMSSSIEHLPEEFVNRTNST
jgi:hypothetical protein